MQNDVPNLMVNFGLFLDLFIKANTRTYKGRDFS